MSCSSCSESNSSNCGDCNPCDATTAAVSADRETLPSALENFIAAFFGTVTKSVVDGRVIWTLPCDLDTGLPENPRQDGEGLACYFKRLFDEGITGLTGATGPQGVPGADGGDGFFVLAEDFAHGGAVLTVTNGDAYAVGQVLFLSRSGWYTVASFTDNVAFVSLLQAVTTPAASVPAGTLILATGPRGATGFTGPAGPTGATGATGSAGAAGADGSSAFATLQTTFTQPAIGGLTGLLTFSDVDWVSVNETVYLSVGGYYKVFAKSASQLNLTNLYGPTENAGAGTTINSGELLSPSGVQGPQAEFAFPTVDPKVADYVMDGSEGIILGEASGGPITITLPNATMTLDGREYIIKRINAGGNDVTIDTQSGQTIDGDATKVLAAQWDFLRVFSYSSSWYVVG